LHIHDEYAILITLIDTIHNSQIVFTSFY